MKKLIFAIAFIMALTIVNTSFVYADDSTLVTDTTVYTFPFREPVVSENSGYVVYLLEDLNNKSRYCVLQTLTIVPRYTTDSDEYDWSDDVFYQMHLGSTKSKIYFNVSSTTMARAFSYRLWNIKSWAGSTCLSSTFTTQTSAEIDWSLVGSGYKCIGYDIVCPQYTIESGIAGKETFRYLFSEEATIYNLQLDILQEIALNNEISADQLSILGDMLDKLQSIDTNTSSLHSQILTISSLLSMVNNNTDLLEYYLDLIYKNVNLIYNRIDLIEGYTDQLEYYLDLIYKNVNNIYNKIDGVEDLLGDLINIFLPSDEGGESNFPDVDTSTQDMYVDIGDSLTSVDTTNQQADLDIDVNSNSGAYTWKLFNDFISSNGKVIGMYITLLSCAFIALILGR